MNETNIFQRKYQKYVLRRYNYLKQYEGYLTEDIIIGTRKEVLKELEFCNLFLILWDETFSEEKDPKIFKITLKNKT